MDGSSEERRNEGRKERGRDVVGIICVIIYDDLALEAWTQSERGREFCERDNEDKASLQIKKTTCLSVAIDKHKT